MKTRQIWLVTLAWCFLFTTEGTCGAQYWTNTSNFDYENMRIFFAVDGSKLITPGNYGSILVSTNAGFTWNTNNTPNNTPTSAWLALAFSAGGNRSVAVGFENYSPLKSAIYTSTNGGTSWISNNTPNKWWVSVASSADGNKLVAVAGDPSNFYPANTWGIYTSTNGGTAWNSNNVPSKPWTCVASSADGNKLVATSARSIYTTTNAGLTWVSNNVPAYYWVSVASSADGNRLVAASSHALSLSQSTIYTSTDGGAVWTLNTVPVSYPTSVASSADGSKLIAVDRNHGIYTTTNAGALWVQNAVASIPWTSAVSSADGNRLAVAGGRAEVYVSYTTPTPSLSIANIGSNTRLSWIIPSLPFSLQQNTDLTTTNWLDFTNQPTLNFNTLEYEVALPLSPVNTFYRLKSSP